MVLLPAERFITTIIAALAVLDAALLFWKGISVDIRGYTVLLAFGLLAIGIGQFYRRARPVEGIALAATAAGLYILFTLVGSVFNYLLLPLRFAPIDGFLAAIDARLGYDWAGFVTWFSQYPVLGAMLRAVYLTSMAQLLLTILVLGFSRRRRMLHEFLLTGTIGALVAVMFWSFFPSFGPSALYALPGSVQENVSLVVGPAYGMELLRLAEQGTSYLTPKSVLGLIAFPSFHTVMACMSVWYLGRVRFIGLPIVALNIVMVPAILVQGGHHLIDLAGGMATFALALVLARIALEQCERTNTRASLSVRTFVNS
ncbi:phosphatase PAP2 family protein [Rhizobiaceae bacterium n13]|uniref:Phosphatase PAP2 family protein n=1 Tax=Ferirhizobium litorale TaxID=2927786 RepID=A0AAE3QJ69_9HYPH|nr:phosphatase PAP2 family protein [Fererhizobium litorale]MDI7864002.1 phosphatase PAP2 family protein [Fererhizobium litorale]MDI7924515.1 phosphatase PAP2 family protein [Fererhizobium litorale]